MSAWAEYVDAYGLTIKEAKLFEVLSDGAVHSRYDLFDRVWGNGHAACDHLVQVHIGRIRNKIGRHGFSITNSRQNGGYRLYRTDGFPLRPEPHSRGQPVMAVAN